MLKLYFAEMVTDCYREFSPRFPYRVEKVLPNGNVKIQHSGRLCEHHNFLFRNAQGDQVTFATVYKGMH